MEDLLECIFGEIRSPSEVHGQLSVEDLGSGRYAVGGGIPLEEFNQEMGTGFSNEYGETLGGLLLHHYGELPAEGAIIEIQNFRFTATEIGNNRIKRVEFVRHPGAGGTREDGQEAGPEETKKETDVAEGARDYQVRDTQGQEES
jgi:magnesium and cobalt transporter